MFAAAWTNIFCRFEKVVIALLLRWWFIFVLRESAIFCAADITASAEVTVEFEIYLCFKNTMPSILVALLFCTHRR